MVEIAAPDGAGTAEHATNSRWTFHGSAGVKLPWNLDLGIALTGREGFPLPYYRRVARDRAGIVRVELSNADAIRASDLITLDLRLAKELTFGDFGVTLGLEAFNLLGASDVLRRTTRDARGRRGTSARQARRDRPPGRLSPTAD